MLFLQIAKGVDDRTWEHHLKAGHYSEWFRDVIKDAELAQAVAKSRRMQVSMRPNPGRGSVRLPALYGTVEGVGNLKMTRLPRPSRSGVVS
jgi:hypothetical protein